MSICISTIKKACIIFLVSASALSLAGCDDAIKSVARKALDRDSSSEATKVDTNSSDNNKVTETITTASVPMQTESATAVKLEPTVSTDTPTAQPTEAPQNTVQKETQSTPQPDFIKNDPGNTPPLNVYTCPVYNTHGGGYVQLRTNCDTKNCITDDSTLGEQLNDGTLIKIDATQLVNNKGKGLTIDFIKVADQPDTWISNTRIVREKCVKN